MTTVVIMPGGFHPFHAGHLALYQSAQRAFPDAEVYVAATNDTSTRPFPFPVKEKLAKLAGVEPGHFVQVKSPFRAEEITSRFNPARDVLIFVRSEKDEGSPPQPGSIKRDGSPSYLQPLLGAEKLEPFAKHAYMAYLPTVEFGPGMTSATQIRTAWPKLNDRRKTALVMSLYPTTQQNPRLAATVVKLLDAAIGTEPVAEGSLEDRLKKYVRPVVKTTPKIERTTNPAGRTTDHVEWKVTGPMGDVTRFSSKKAAQAHYDSFSKPGVAKGSLNEFAPGDGNDEENPLDDYPCYDCGSTIYMHHTRLCDLAEPSAVRDLPAQPGTQHWTGRVPKGLKPIPGLNNGVAEGFLNEASSDEAWELVGQPVPEIQQFVKQMGYGDDEQSVEKITQIIDSAKSSQIPFANIPKLKNLANKGNDAQTLKAILKISGRPDAEQQYIKLMQARDASEGRERDITGYIQYVKSGNYDPPVLLKLSTGLYVVGGRTRLYAALALGVPATVKILSADNFKQGVAEGVEFMSDAQFYGEILSVLAAVGAGLATGAYLKVKDIVKMYNANQIMRALEGYRVGNISDSERRALTKLLAEFKQAMAQRQGEQALVIANQIKSIATDRPGVAETVSANGTVANTSGAGAGMTASYQRRDNQPVDEGWKDVVAGGAMALGALGANAQSMPNINAQQVELTNKYYKVLVQRAVEDGRTLDARTKNFLMAKAQDAAAQKIQKSTAQSPTTQAKPQFPSQGSEQRRAKDFDQFESQDYLSERRL